MDIERLFISDDEKRSEELQRIRDEFIEKGDGFFYTESLRSFDRHICQTHRILKEYEDRIPPNRYFESLMDQFSHVGSDVFFVIPDCESRHQDIIRAYLEEQDEDSYSITEMNPLHESDEETFLLVKVPEEETDTIAFLHGMCYSHFENTPLGSYRILSHDIFHFLKYLRNGETRLLNSGERWGFSYLGQRHLIYSDPIEIHYTRRAVERLLEMGIVESELEFYLHLFYRLVPLFQNNFLRTKDISRYSRMNVRAEKERLFSRLVGEGIAPTKWTKENRLFRMVHDIYPDAVFQYRPDWLRPQSLDIYIPHLSTAIEYQGEQHFIPFPHLGGEEGLEYRKLNDRMKKGKCLSQGIRLVEWMYDEDIDESLLRRKLDFKGTLI